ncbi:MAG: hypothetical protein IPK82_40200 [Polyangiaceae bacterium]|nr:hypothetical protein [Polyangiaceae bacterium]
MATRMDSGTSPIVNRGRIICYRIFDVADVLVLAEAEDLLLRAQVARASMVMRPPPLRKTGALAVAAVPLHVDVGTKRIVLPEIERSLLSHVSVNLFDYGKISVVFEIPIRQGTALDELRPLCQELYESQVVSSIALEECGTYRERVRTALHRNNSDARATGPNGEELPPRMEAFTIIFVEELEGKPLAKDVLAWTGLPKLIIGEAADRPLGEKQTRDTMQHADGYLDNDLVVIDWNSAFVLEPSGSRDIPDILEFARSMLLQLLVYDDHLDVELRQINHEFTKRRGSGVSVLNTRYRKLTHEVSARLIEVTELNERIENSFKIIGDYYLARVYRTAVARFGIPVVRESVARKHLIVHKVYDMLKGEVELLRGQALELTIILLIVIEVVLGAAGVLKSH